MNAHYNLNRWQLSLLDGYLALDPECQFLGWHRGRPVIYTYTSRIGEHGKRHVVMLLKSGDPGDLPENWEDHFEFAQGVALPGIHAAPSPPVVRGVVWDWLSWSVRA